MRRIVLGYVVIVLAGWTAARSAPVTEDPPKPRLLVDRLALPVGAEIGVFNDQQTKIGEALDHLAKHHEFSVDYNERAFQSADANYTFDNYFGAPLLDRGPIAVSKDKSIARVIRAILARVPFDGSDDHAATFVVRGSCVEITTVEAVRNEFYGKDYEGPLLPLVTVDFQSRSLNDALKTLATQSGCNVALDPREADKAGNTAISAQLTNTPFDSALRVLVDMGSLKYYRTGNIYYVTSPENAAALAAEDEQKPGKKKRLPEAQEGGGNPFARPGAGSGSGS
jgi:hypothetical protein